MKSTWVSSGVLFHLARVSRQHQDRGRVSTPVCVPRVDDVCIPPVEMAKDHVCDFHLELWKSVAGAHSGKKGEAIGQDSREGANYARGTPKEECHSHLCVLAPLGMSKGFRRKKPFADRARIYKTIVTFASHTHPGNNELECRRLSRFWIPSSHHS